MTTFIGYSTIGQNKKFTLTDVELVKRDLLNAFNIRQGQLPGVPQYGTVLWDYIFEPQMQETQEGIYEEVQRVAGLDPRLQITDIQVFPWDNGMLLQLELNILPSSVDELLYVFFNQDSRTASYVSPG